ncbi:carbon-nitrogen hydrolase family protein [Roseivirga echinicomitans]|uniref:Hydrolase n=1 Tax=Roseivirga echinicomitans TaxID=296218 RepID=A0A150WYK6_9BACT|nr:carbon-nitrogen hydrolase family protein [Roseivirga echinicomitans]KYG71570.1 hydrolase [Roseivirga echinicomitans]
MKPFTIAGIQMKVSATHSNLEMMKLKLDITMNVYPAVDLVLFSELCGYGPLTYYAQELPGHFEDEMKAMAKKHKIWLVPGSIFEKSGDKIYNTALVINPQGEVVSRYRKMFPFYPYEVGVTPGSEFCIFDIPDVGRFGLSICYDMWFPETIRTLAVMGAEVILHPTLTGTMDRDIEHSIAQTMAAVNQCFFFDINGLDSGGIGRSTVCGPDGRIMYQAGSTEEIIPIEIDMERVQRSRELGVMRLGQPLKSFRDHMGDFNIYNPNKKHEYLESLGPLIKPQKPEQLTELKQRESMIQLPVNLVE